MPNKTGHRKFRSRADDPLEQSVWNAVRKARLPFRQRLEFAERVREDLLLRRRIEADEMTLLDDVLLNWRAVLKRFRENVQANLGA